MKLDLSEILAHIGMRFPYEVDEPPLVDEDLECTSRIAGHLTFTNTGSVLLVEGAARANVALPCSRCLVYFEEQADAPISEQFLLETRTLGSHGRQTQIVVEQDENPDAGRLFDGPLFDLTELLRQNILISLPSRPLHSESCKGLCMLCGKDLNEGSCECVPEPANPALARLGALLKERSQS